MRHRKKYKLSIHKSTKMNIITSLIKHEIIKISLSRAKKIRGIIEPLITLSKIDTTTNRRIVFSKIRDVASVSKLFKIIGPKLADRPGGYTRILKSKFRQGDNAPMAYIELLSRNIKK